MKSFFFPLRVCALALLYVGAFPALASADPLATEISWRTGALLAADQSFFTVGLGLRLRTDAWWTIEASADMAVTEGSPIPNDFDGMLGAVPLALAGLYRPLPDWPLSPFVELGGGLNLFSGQVPEPFLHGGGGASYQWGAWGVATGLRLLFLPGQNASDLLNDRGLQMTFSIQREL